MYFNRDLSWLSFNLRVLEEAADLRVPLFERLKFLAIFSSNLDEFFRVRYPVVMAITQLKKKTKARFNELNENVPEKVQIEIHRQLQLYGTLLTQQILPALAENDIILYWRRSLESHHKAEVKEIFLSQVLSFIQPVILDSADDAKFYPENNQLYLVVSLKLPGEQVQRHAVVNIPSEELQRFYSLSRYNGKNYVVFIDDIIRENLDLLFPNYQVLSAYGIKLNRDAELRLEDEYTGDLAQKMEKQLAKRDYGPPSRFLYEEGLPRNVQLFLASAFGVELDEMFQGNRYHNLSDFMKFPTFGKALEYEKWRPLTPPGLKDYADMFDVLNQKDLLLHLPYQTYNPVLAFFNQAAVDPEVTEVYITLYRVAAESHIVNALISAAKNGKRVTAFIELKARFDEANNLRWSKRMEDAGVKIIYSIPEIKVHSKIALIKKGSSNHSIYYSILSTGNFNESTARFYTDHVLMTADFITTKEILQLFNFLQERNRPSGKDKLDFQRLMVSQFNFMTRFEMMVEREMKKAVEGEPARIRIKVNNLEEHFIINLLYKASQAGVKVELIVRSVCCLVPGLEGLSENIKVKRIVDRYLEHSRLFMFGSGATVDVWMGSADLMNRNLHSRIEVCVAMNDVKLKQQLIDYFEIQWEDTDKAVILNPYGEQLRQIKEGDASLNAQSEIYKYVQQLA